MQSHLNNTVQLEKLYDLSFIEKVCRGNDASLRKMIKTFISTIPSAVEEIKAAYNRFDFDTVKKTAHRIKPTLAIYAVVKLEKDILHIEQLAKNETADQELNLKIRILDDIVKTIVCSMKTEFSID